jgi:ferric-dicitrate binding protein FerR (iron transport regulator)
MTTEHDIDKDDDMNRRADGELQGALNEERIAALLQKIGPRPQPGADVTASIQANVKAVWREEVALQQAQRQNRRKTVGFALAASVLLSFGASWLLSTPAQTSAFGVVAQVINRVEYVDGDGEWRSLGEQALRQSIEVRTGSAGSLRLRLNDGMDIRVGANSRLAMLAGGALTLHTGVIYVDSNDQLDVGNSLRVTTPFGEAEDIGTQFAVRVAPDGWQVQVRDGLVKMSDDGLQRQVNAGDRVVIDQRNDVTVSQVASDDTSWAWIAAVSPEFLIEGASLQAYVGWLSRETGKTVVFSSAQVSESARGTILHGSIDGLLPMESLSVVLAATDFYLIDSEPGKLVIDRQ